MLLRFAAASCRSRTWDASWSACNRLIRQARAHRKSSRWIASFAAIRRWPTRSDCAASPSSSRRTVRTSARSSLSSPLPRARERSMRAEAIMKRKRARNSQWKSRTRRRRGRFVAGAGVSTSGGFKLMVQDRATWDYARCRNRATSSFAPSSKKSAKTMPSPVRTLPAKRQATATDDEEEHVQVDAHRRQHAVPFQYAAFYGHRPSPRSSLSKFRLTRSIRRCKSTSAP